MLLHFLSYLPSQGLIRISSKYFIMLCIVALQKSSFLVFSDLNSFMNAVSHCLKYLSASDIPLHDPPLPKDFASLPNFSLMRHQLLLVIQPVNSNIIDVDIVTFFCQSKKSLNSGFGCYVTCLILHCLVFLIHDIVVPSLHPQLVFLLDIFQILTW